MGKSGCIRVKVVSFDKKWMYSGKVVVFEQRWLYSGKRCYIRAKWLFSGKKLLYSGKSGCFRATCL